MTTAVAAAPKRAEVEIFAIDALKPDQVFTAGGAAPLLADIEISARALATSDISTPAARKAVGAVAYSVARLKTALDEMGKVTAAEWKKKSAGVDLERRILREGLDALKDEVRKPLTDWETAEDTRIADQNAKLAEIEALVQFDMTEPTAGDIQARLDLLASGFSGNWDWQEFAARATEARERAQVALAALLVAAKKREAERAELEALRVEKAKRDARDLRRADALVGENVALASKVEAVKAEAAEQIEAVQAQTAALVAEAAAKAADDVRKQIAAVNDKATADALDRASDVAHRGKINGAARDAIAKLGLSPEHAVLVVTAIVRGSIPNVTINY
jgi:colicin import membrane protein